MNHDYISRRNSSFTIKEFEKWISISLMDIKHTVKNQWFDDIKRLCKQVIVFGRSNILFLQCVWSIS